MCLSGPSKLDYGFIVDWLRIAMIVAVRFVGGFIALD